MIWGYFFNSIAAKVGRAGVFSRISRICGILAGEDACAPSFGNKQSET